VGDLEQFGSLARIPAARRTARGSPTPLSPTLPEGPAPPAPEAAGAARPAPEHPGGSLGAQEGSRGDSCRRRRPSLSPSLCLARAAAHVEQGDKAAAPRPRSCPAQARPHSPLPRSSNPWAPPSPSAPTAVCPLPPRRARSRAPASPPPLPLCQRPSVPVRLRTPGFRLRAPPGAGSFPAAAAALRPLPPDVRRGGGGPSGGRGRDAKASPGDRDGDGGGAGCDRPRPAGPALSTAGV
jgi:hypothetical protein